LNVIVTRNTNTSSYEEFDFNRLNRLASNSGGIALKTDTGDSAENYKAKIVESILQTRIIHGELPADFFFIIGCKIRNIINAVPSK
jgi:hypothetical protein